jgi:hypothetical protein
MQSREYRVESAWSHCALHTALSCARYCSWATRVTVRQSKELAVQRGDTEHAEFWVRAGGRYGWQSMRSTTEERGVNTRGRVARGGRNKHLHNFRFYTHLTSAPRRPAEEVSGAEGSFLETRIPSYCRSPQEKVQCQTWSELNLFPVPAVVADRINELRWRS